MQLQGFDTPATICLNIDKCLWNKLTHTWYSDWYNIYRTCVQVNMFSFPFPDKHSGRRPLRAQLSLHKDFKESGYSSLPRQRQVATEKTDKRGGFWSKFGGKKSKRWAGLLLDFNLTTDHPWLWYLYCDQSTLACVPCWSCSRNSEKGSWKWSSFKDGTECFYS